MSHGDRRAVLGAFYLVAVEEFSEASDYCSPAGPFEHSLAATTEVPYDTASSVELLLTEVVQPLLNKRGYAALLCALSSVGRGFHGCPV